MPQRQARSEFPAAAPQGVEGVVERLRLLPESGVYRVAYSGGMDSHVLLHVLSRQRAILPGQLSAVHVDHDLHPDSGKWAGHCAAVCRALKVPLDVIPVQARGARGRGVEGMARELRYRALGGRMQSGDMLLTAHHLDDQAETLLLQLFRGAGPAGLAGMPALKAFHAGLHARPLLPVSRDEIRRYAARHGLEWIEDPGNRDRRFDRNFLRHEILPALRARWPSVDATLARAAGHQAGASHMLAAMGTQDLAACRTRRPGALDLGVLGEFDPLRLGNVLRQWFASLDLPVPDSDGLRRIREEVMLARPDARPVLRWPGAEVRRYRTLLFASRPMPVHDASRSVHWRFPEPCEIGPGTLTAFTDTVGPRLLPAACSAHRVEVRYRHGGERLQMPGARHRRALKLLFQERGIPPWIRSRIPLVYLDGALAAVADFWVDEVFHAAGEAPGWRIRWSGPEAECCVEAGQGAAAG